MGERAILAGHTDAVHAVAFSPDGTHILTGSEDHTARLWDAATGKTTAILAGHTSRVWAVAFSPDGSRVVTGSGGFDDNMARVWDAGMGFPGPEQKSGQALIDTVRTTVPRCLTPEQREAYHLGTPPPRWCYERNLWPFADHGRPYDEGLFIPPYGPAAPAWDERLLAAWGRIGSWFSRSSAGQEGR